jgi:hypothetical protein
MYDASPSLFEFCFKLLYSVGREEGELDGAPVATLFTKSEAKLLGAPERREESLLDARDCSVDGSVEGLVVG